MSKPVGVSRISSNSERETITVHLNRTMFPEEEFMLRIKYRGLAIMDEYGLYESWDKVKSGTLIQTNLLILASRNFPTGARSWFSCFDEPDKKATFELKVNHPSRLNVYSNSEVERTIIASPGRNLTLFKKTYSRPTYQVALSVNNFASQSIDVKGFGKVVLISISREN
ncbi:hypothetical protein PENTCL1PPCAC_7750, partial [Pristionchus entomophagus]